MANYLVTGGAGFIGSNIVKALVEQGESVRVLDNCSTGNLSNLEEVIDRIEFILGDIRDPALAHKAVEEIDYLIHQAALCSVAYSVDDPVTTNEVNVTGILNMLTAAKDLDVKRIVYASSASVYGDSPGLPKNEDMPTNPVSPYATSKLIGEQYCKLFYELYNLETVTLRYFNVFGPRQACNSHYSAAIPKFIGSFLEGKSPTIFGDGEQSRDLVFVEDAVQANILACHAESAAGEIFNIGCGRNTTINCLVKIIDDLIGSDIEPVYEQERRGDVRHSQADISKAQKVLDYKPIISLEAGLERTIHWFKTKAVGFIS
jgi:nucleoside-diphosphate-sugar epimerase